jgi:hypothetical protein
MTWIYWLTLDAAIITVAITVFAINFIVKRQSRAITFKNTNCSKTITSRNLSLSLRCKLQHEIPINGRVAVISSWGDWEGSRFAFIILCWLKLNGYVHVAGVHKAPLMGFYGLTIQRPDSINNGYLVYVGMNEKSEFVESV